MSSGANYDQASGYLVDAENIAEMARLAKQARLTTEQTGLVPATIDLGRCATILDIGCGPGEWSLAIAQQLPMSRVTGIDISTRMTEYAQYLVQENNLSNANFHAMDARRQLDFPDNSFDLIHMRFINSFLSKDNWPVLLQECFRLLRAGGYICSTEAEGVGVTTSPSLTRYNRLMTQILRASGHAFVDEGDSPGITAVQMHLLQVAGFQTIQHEAFSSNYSHGTAAHTVLYEDFKALFKLLQPAVVHYKLASQEELDVLYQRVLSEMQDQTFCAVSFYQRVWGIKPA
ncbi:class I SAM-dependent methyltransferase [Ktedonosporobacter rubrisoli]|uniref:Class I SAM-dependent methyltransferase n=1 Tax=Ktedonosporobacter rubrisoli TaxID=2509675 RepID=A0A4P6JI47_KTERU|nr:class I SAM-dependent methyltransferase [Ktedonosporobacter rubrisoli]QBD74550.1 class I SAM-dependent methyltransferase [Ktedonosporobacter rubrisoli]